MSLAPGAYNAPKAHRIDILTYIQHRMSCASDYDR